MGMARDFGISPVKQPAVDPNQPKLQFYSHQKVKNDKRKDSNFNGPIMPSHFPNNMIHHTQPQDPRFHHHHQFHNDVSTRPNSNISIHCPTDDDVPNKKKNKKKKKKPASVQNKQEEHLNGDNFIIGPSKIKGGKPASSPHIGFFGFGSPEADEKLDEPLEPKKLVLKMSGSKFNDSFESLVSYTTEKTGTVAEKTQKANNEQFKKQLANALIKKGLDYTIQYLLSPLTNIEGLKLFSQKDFYLYPQIRVEDKEKIALIIKTLLEEEDISGQINGEFLSSNNGFENNPFEESNNPWLGNFNFLENENLGFTKHPFSSY